MSALVDSFKASAEKAKTYSSDNPAIVAGGVVAAVSGVYLLSRYLTVTTTDEGRKGSFGLSLGKEANGDSAWNRFASSWSQGHKQAEGGTGAGNMHDPAEASSLVNDFYSFVTDIYEWGWGASFHFAPKIWSHDWKAGEACQEVRIAHMLRATPGMKVLDVGCGVGGPMRIIAASTGAHITGITISEYQVERCKKLNAKAGMSEVTEVIQGDFHKMPFADNSFDAIFSVEATCHASSLPEVYSEIFRVLKPGGCFVSQEWVSTKAYNADNNDHVRIIEEINFGNSLPNMRTWSEAESAGKQVGFQLVTAYDAAPILLGPNKPWFERLTQFRHLHLVDDVIIKVLGTLRLIPRTLIDVHTMLVRVATSLVKGGESGVFTPMYMLCFEKPQ
eukprot:jgi/Ulvmu1/9486/UM052_0056.1